MTKQRYKSLSLLTAFLFVGAINCGSSSAREVSGDVCQDVSELKQVVRGLRRINGDSTIREAGDAAMEVTTALGKVGESAQEYSKEKSEEARQSYDEFSSKVKETPDNVTINQAINMILKQVGSLLNIANGLASELNCNNTESGSRNFDSNEPEFQEPTRPRIFSK